MKEDETGSIFCSGEQYLLSVLSSKVFKSLQRCNTPVKNFFGLRRLLSTFMLLFKNVLHNVLNAAINSRHIYLALSIDAHIKRFRPAPCPVNDFVIQLDFQVRPLDGLTNKSTVLLISLVGGRLPFKVPTLQDKGLFFNLARL